jgi:ketosteroid isomerase-like protein
MNKRAFVLPIVLCGAFLATPLWGQEQDARESSIRALEEQERQAVLRSDTDTLQRLWSPLMIVNNPQSTITPDREAILNLVRGGFIKYSSFERTIEAVRFHGDLAIVMGAEKVDAIGRNPKAGQQVKRRFTNVWARTGETWQVIARHANVIRD